jgi:hypothetical protein
LWHKADSSIDGSPDGKEAFPNFGKAKEEAETGITVQACHLLPYSFSFVFFLFFFLHSILFSILLFFLFFQVTLLPVKCTRDACFPGDFLTIARREGERMGEIQNANTQRDIQMESSGLRWQFLADDPLAKGLFFFLIAGQAEVVVAVRLQKGVSKKRSECNYTTSILVLLFGCCRWEEASLSS